MERFSEFLGKDLALKLNLNYSTCTQDLNYYVGGNFLSTEYNYIEISLQKWTGMSYCKSSTEIDSILNQMKLGVALSNYFFDSDNYDNPVKINYSNDYETWIMGSLKKNIELRFRK